MEVDGLGNEMKLFRKLEQQNGGNDSKAPHGIRSAQAITQGVESGGRIRFDIDFGRYM